MNSSSGVRRPVYGFVTTDIGRLCRKAMISVLIYLQVAVLADEALLPEPMQI
jgi:hypothetical protein